MSGLTNLQVENFGKKLLGSNFVGVYPCDAIPKLTNRKKAAIIFNLSKHNEPGSHYVTVVFFKNKIFYFDSYGKTLTNPYIKSFLGQFSNEKFYHTRRIQPKNSIFCGLYCLAYIIYVMKNCENDYAPFYSMFFYPPHKQNDAIVTKYIMKNKKK